MPYRLFDYLDAHGDNPFHAWATRLQKTEKGKLKARIDMLAAHGEDLFPEILAGSPIAGILKMKVHGKVQLRPLLCRGPFAPKGEYTFLAGATERDSKFDPKDAPEVADSRRAVLVLDQKRRRDHVRIT